MKTPEGREYLLHVRPFRRHLATTLGTVIKLVDVTVLTKLPVGDAAA